MESTSCRRLYAVNPCSSSYIMQLRMGSDLKRRRSPCYKSVRHQRILKLWFEGEIVTNCCFNFETGVTLQRWSSNSTTKEITILPVEAKCGSSSNQLFFSPCAHRIIFGVRSYTGGLRQCSKEAWSPINHCLITTTTTNVLASQPKYLSVCVCVCVCVCARKRERVSGPLRRRERAISPGSELPLWSPKAKQRERDARPSQRGLNIPESGHHNSLSPPHPPLRSSPIHPTFLRSLPPPVYPGYHWVSRGAAGKGEQVRKRRGERKSKGETVQFFKSQEDIWAHKDFDCFTHTGQSLDRS